MTAEERASFAEMAAVSKGMVSRALTLSQSRGAAPRRTRSVPRADLSRILPTGKPPAG